jgi:hypothetical protein
MDLQQSPEEFLLPTGQLLKMKIISLSKWKQSSKLLLEI